MPIALADILKNEGVSTHFQPIVAVKHKAVFGVEALSRGFDSEAQVVIPPCLLFTAAAAENRILELDRLCRKKALEAFKEHFLANSEILLFLNFEVSVLDQGVGGSGQLLSLIEQLGIPPQRVVIEVVESKVENVQALLSFIQRYREGGFLIALDDIGAGHSNLDRIALLKPDILKIDASLIRGLEKDYYKQEVCRSLVNLARKIGSLVLAEGVETAPEALASLELGAEFIQGYYLGRPVPAGSEILDHGQRVITGLADAFRKTMVAKLKNRRNQHQAYNRRLNRVLAVVAEREPHEFDAILAQAGRDDGGVEHFYILDQQGQQVTDFCQARDSQVTRSHLRFNARGMDHSLKDYYYLTMEGSLRRYTTEPYISLATGRLCVTLVAWFKSLDQRDYLLCMDVNPQAML